MTEFIGSRISLVSRSDIRYVGTLHEINSEDSTVALENVTSFGTEGRKGNPDEEIPASDSVYEYIVFRGSDVKDLRIEEAPAAKENKPPQMPDDPAILGSGNRPPRQANNQPQGPPQNQSQPQQGPQGQGRQGQQGPPPQGGQYPPPFYPPPPGQWGRGGPPPGPGFPGMPPPYGAPPGWYPPPGQGFPQPGPFPYGPYGPYPPGPPGQQFPPQGKPAPIGSANKQQTGPAGPVEKGVEPKSLAKPAPQTGSGGPSQAPTPAAETKKDTPSAPAQPTAPVAEPKTAPTGPKNAKIMPAVPLPTSTTAKAPLQANAGNAGQTSTAPTRAAVDDATQAATAAVAAAMAKLPPLGGQQTNGNSVDNLTKKVNEMRTNDPIRAPRQPGSGGFGQRGRGRGGHRQETRKIEVPETDFDFESSNAKFNKEDLVKEAIASGSPLGDHGSNGNVPEVEDTEVAVPANPVYDRKSSFFDDLSSDNKDRAEGENKRGGREWRGEEQKKNLETFGQGSVDTGYRGGYRGRGRGRGGMRGRGYRGSRGGYRGGRGDSEGVVQ